ncbi:uncharacterized protein TNCV_1917981 [Trichonephila clavipes]|uniref:Uncharacterized protein n=1 Tax=Trichonephila clavipes TaxID=2585209 RepID=A0A8X6W0K2_TRICX|nr:uncharacterized protein TNCV_1917981 [Trichonephila clavipes]
MTPELAPLSPNYRTTPTGGRFSSRHTAAVAEWYRHRIVAGFVTSSSPVPLKTRRNSSSIVLQHGGGAVLEWGCKSVSEIEESSILLVCAAKVRFLKLQDADQERDADEANPKPAEQGDNGTPAYSPRCSKRRQLDEADVSTSVDQRSANYQEEAVQSFTVMQSRCRSSSADLTIVVHCQFFELFDAHQSTASKIASLWNGSAAHELLLRDIKILLLEGR